LRNISSSEEKARDKEEGRDGEKKRNIYSIIKVDAVFTLHGKCFKIIVTVWLAGNKKRNIVDTDELS
jgi:hypothetical protein